MNDFIPPQPPKSHRIVLDLTYPSKRLDSVLLTAMKAQGENSALKAVTRAIFKQLFKDGRILIKGQKASPSSSLAKGITYVDILGF